MISKAAALIASGPECVEIVRRRTLLWFIRLFFNAWLPILWSCCVGDNIAVAFVPF
jgi:hypothetical protein